MWDFTEVIWKTSRFMRYDTPGDWYGDTLEAWKGMPPLNQQAILLHEFNESVILRAAGITVTCPPKTDPRVMLEWWIWRCPLFWTSLSEKIWLFSVKGFMVYSACPPGCGYGLHIEGGSPGQVLTLIDDQLLGPSQSKPPASRPGRP
jgi:hypothetical protein